MNLTSKQKLFWIAAIAAAVLYFGHSFFLPRPTAPIPRPSPVPAPAQATPPAKRAVIPGRPTGSMYAAQMPGSPAAGSDAAPTPLPFDTLLGIWQGGAALGDLGLCSVKVELRRKDNAPDTLAGFPIVACMPFAPTVPNLRSPAAAQKALAARMSPVSGVLTGTNVNGTLTFTVDKTVGASSDGCSITAFTVTPFGTDQIAADWTEGNCAKEHKGQMMLKRIGA